jgi:hypothetical protein
MFFTKYYDLIQTYGLAFWPKDYKLSREDLVLFYGVCFIVTSVIEHWV